jgi:hypothetical protein
VPCRAAAEVAAAAFNPLRRWRTSAGTDAIMSATNCCCTLKAWTASRSIDDTRNRRPSGNVARRERGSGDASIGANSCDPESPIELSGKKVGTCDNPQQ